MAVHAPVENKGKSSKKRHFGKEEGQAPIKRPCDEEEEEEEATPGTKRRKLTTYYNEEWPILKVQAHANVHR